MNSTAPTTGPQVASPPPPAPYRPLEIRGTTYTPLFLPPEKRG